MKLYFSLLLFFVLQADNTFSQQVIFKKAVQNIWSVEQFSGIVGATQDMHGYIWFATQNNGLIKYNGRENEYYKHDLANINSLASNSTLCVYADSDNLIWAGTFNGLDRYDQTTKTYTHFRHDPKDASSLGNDSINTIFQDHYGNIWIGTFEGLDLLDKKNGKFSHYKNDPKDPTSFGGSFVPVIYEDHQGVLWIGACNITSNYLPVKGFLNRFDHATRKFKQYTHDPKNPNSLEGDYVHAIFEDSKGNFWVGTSGDGLQTMDREKGTFTHYYYDAQHPDKLSRPPICHDCPFDPVTFISEDASGSLWIASVYNGVNQYDPVSKKITHYGSFKDSFAAKPKTDTATGGLNTDLLSFAFSSNDKLFWICSYNGSAYTTNPFKITVPFDSINGMSANTLYYEEKVNMLWIGTSKGLLRKNLNNGEKIIWKHDRLNQNSLGNDTIAAIRVDSGGRLWMATNNGLCRYDPLTNNFLTYRHNDKDPNSISTNLLSNLCIDHDQNIWITSWNNGLDKMDSKKGIFTHYAHIDNDTNSLTRNSLYCVAEGPSHEIWAGTDYGVNLLDNKMGKFHRYLQNSSIKNIFADHAGIIWLGTDDGLYQFDRSNNLFELYIDPNTRTSIKNILHIMEDSKKNLWVTTTNSFVKINAAHDQVKRFGANYGIHGSDFVGGFADNFSGKNGELFFGDSKGYYAFFPEQLKGNSNVVQVSITSFKLGDKEMIPTAGGVLSEPLWRTSEIKLNYDQNIFSFDFAAISYTSDSSSQYLFRLENYDNTWHFLGTDHKAYFFNIPPGAYVFHAKAIKDDDSAGEKTIRIIITPPWWRTWWAYTIFILSVIAFVWGFIYYRSRKLSRENKLLEEKVSHRTEQLKKSLEELRSTQTQLVQSEKMASLGELTAGIAHEIQNPLNFVNNFSEVSNELIGELQEERHKPQGIRDEQMQDEILKDIKQNLEKINHHGKRADAIVKGMLQHSQSNAGVRELTDINKLADEYLRLAYHGLRAKNNAFNTTMLTDFNPSISQINIVPQDIGRVLLNLYNNAFYAVNEKKNASSGSASNLYEPTVSVSTKKTDNKILITVRDNGNGIPQKVIDKIFQPFFTTKPTGQGTGLGLSLSYDILKANGGEIKVNSAEAEFTEFVVQLPV